MNNETDYKSIRAEINRLHTIMENAPQSAKMGYQISAGGILNAYREGDISYDDAKHLIESGKLTRNKSRFLTRRHS